MLKFLVLVLTVFCASTSFAKTAKSSKRPKAPKFAVRLDCNVAAMEAVYKEFSDAMGMSSKEVDEIAHIDDATIEDQKSPNDLTVEVVTNNSMDWDGYATYSVTVAPTAKACAAVKAKLVSSEGL